LAWAGVAIGLLAGLGVMMALPLLAPTLFNGCAKYLQAHPEIDPRGFTCDPIGYTVAVIVGIIVAVAVILVVLRISETLPEKRPNT